MLWSYPPLNPLASVPADAPPLPTEKAEDGKSLLSLPPSDKLSPWYTSYPEVLDESNNGTPLLFCSQVQTNPAHAAFDFHIYYSANVRAQLEHARKLHERIRREFPELRVYQFWEVPVGCV